MKRVLNREVLAFHPPLPKTMPDDMTSMLQNMVSSTQGKIGRMAEQSQQAEKQLSLLMLAAETGQENIICYLLDRGESINTETELGWTALKKAVSGHHPTIVRLLAQRGAIMSAAHTALPLCI